MKKKDTVMTPSMQQVEAERERLRSKKKYNKALKSTVSVLIVIAAAAVLIATLLLPVLQISGSDLEPFLKDGDIIALVSKKNFSEGELVGFYYQGKVLIKRVIGLPGDIINIDREGNVSVNDVLLDEPYVINKSRGECDMEFPYKVPEDRYFVIGDNRDTSIDSRSSVIGCIEKEQIIGRVFLKVWPIKEFSPLG